MLQMPYSPHQEAISVSTTKQRSPKHALFSRPLRILSVDAANMLRHQERSYLPQRDSAASRHQRDGFFDSLDVVQSLISYNTWVRRLAESAWKYLEGIYNEVSSLTGGIRRGTPSCATHALLLCDVQAPCMRQLCLATTQII
jgi:hypothetical protein